MFDLLKSSRRKVVIIIIGLLMVSLGTWFWLGRIDTKIIGKDATIKRVVFGTEKTENAYISIPYTADSQKYLYVNIAIDLNKDGKFADYQVDGKTQNELVAQNIDTRVFASEGANYDFKLSDFKVDNQKDFPIQIILTKKPINNWRGKKLRGSAYQITTISSIEADDIDTRFSPSSGMGSKTGFWGNLSTSAFAQDQTSVNTPPVSSEDLQKELEDKTKAEILKRSSSINSNPAPTPKSTEKTISTLGKEFDVFNSDIPDITQGKNECAPTSVTNSLLWLAKKNKFDDKMPKTQTDLLGELKSDLKWTVENGVTDDNFITGKKAFASRHNIPIEVHRVAAKDYDTNIVAKIAQELQNGQDVEVGIEFWQKQANGKWKLMGGHWVTAVGARGNRDGSQTLDIHDPASPGPSSLDSYKIDDTKIVDYRYRGAYVAFIQYAVAESPITPPVVTPSDSSSPTNSATPTVTSTTPKNQEKFIYTRDTRPSIETGMIGEYTITKEDGLNALKIKFKPTRQQNVDKKINGVELTLADQNPPLPSTPAKMNFSVNGGTVNADWTCMLVKGDTANKVSCSGTKTVELNKDSFFDVFFETAVEQVNPLYLHFTSDGTVISAMNPIAK